MKYLSESVSSELITHELAFDAVSEAFIAATADGKIFPVVIAHGGNRDNIFSLKSASTRTHCGWKTGSYWADNHQNGIPCHASTIFLLDNQTGYLSAVIEGSQVNAFRTAAADAVSIEHLAKKGASNLAVFGTGHQAAYECRAIARIRPIEHIHVVGRNENRVAAFVDELQKDGLHAAPAQPQVACENADVIVTATTSKSPLFHADWVQPGTHVSAMGADTKGKQELPTDLLNRASLFCDLTSQSVEIGEFQHWAVDTSNPNPSVTMLGHVLNQTHPGRTCQDEITVFDSSGISLQDLFVGIRLLEQAEREGRAIELN